jgi:uncharacterized protein YdaU (DUF1376 family)
MHYFKFNLKDYAFATRYFDYVHHGAYLQLISLYYETEKPIPLDIDFVLKRVMASKQEEVDAVKHVLENFFVKTEDGYVQKRCDDVIAKYQAQCSVNREVGKLGGRPKANENRIGSEKKPTENPNHKPLTINKEPVNKEPVVVSKATPLLKPQDVEETVWRDYLKIRNAKKSPLTETALKGLLREAEKAGKSLNQALVICVENGWIGFKADWASLKTVEDTPKKWPGI